MRHKVGVRALRDGLSRWLERVRKGDIVVVTDHGRAVAHLTPAPASPSAETEEEWVRRMLREGRLVGGDGTPDPAEYFLGPEVDLQGTILANRREERS